MREGRSAQPELRPELLQLFASFLHGFSHTIRTPLSVINNDLAYFETLVGAAECTRSQRRCREIAELLDTIHISHIGEPKRISINSLIQTLNAHGIPVPPAKPNRLVLCYPDTLTHGLRLLVCFLRETFQITKYTAEESDVSFLLQTLLPPSSSMSFPQSLSSYLARQQGTSSPVPAFVETIFLAHGIESVVTQTDTAIQFTISIPLADEN